MNKSILSVLALGLIAGTSMAQSFSFSGTLSQVGGAAANGSFFGTFTPATGALTLSGTTFYSSLTVSPATPPSITSGTITPGPATVPAVGAGTTATLSFTLPVLGTVNLNTRSQTFTGSGTATLGVPQTIRLFDGGTQVLTGSFTPVPEPETYAAVAALGLVGYGVWRRRNA
jgi:MYXO-CTERM domain-containing protein